MPLIKKSDFTLSKDLKALLSMPMPPLVPKEPKKTWVISPSTEEKKAYTKEVEKYNQDKQAYPAKLKEYETKLSQTHISELHSKLLQKDAKKPSIDLAQLVINLRGLLKDHSDKMLSTKSDSADDKTLTAMHKLIHPALGSVNDILSDMAKGTTIGITHLTDFLDLKKASVQLAGPKTLAYFSTFIETLNILTIQQVHPFLESELFEKKLMKVISIPAKIFVDNKYEKDNLLNIVVSIANLLLTTICDQLDDYYNKLYYQYAQKIHEYQVLILNQFQVQTNRAHIEKLDQEIKEHEKHHPAFETVLGQYHAPSPNIEKRIQTLLDKNKGAGSNGSDRDKKEQPKSASTTAQLMVVMPTASTPALAPMPPPLAHTPAPLAAPELTPTAVTTQKTNSQPVVPQLVRRIQG